MTATRAGLAARSPTAAPATRRRRAIGAAIAGVSIGGIAAAAVAVLAGGDRARARTPWPTGPLLVRRLTTSVPEQQPASVVLSRDGQTLAYTVGAALFVRPIDGGVPTPVPLPSTRELTRARLAFALGIFPDGRFLIEVLDRDQRWGLWTIGGAREPLLLWQDSGRVGAALSPDGTQVAIASRDRGVVVMASAGGPSRRIAIVEPGARVGGVAWSPDGAEVAFVRYPPDGSDDTLEVVAADGGQRRVLVRAALASPTDQLVAWPAPDRIVYAAASGGGAALAAVRLRGHALDGAPVELVRWPGEHVGIGASGGGRLALLRGTSRDQLVTTKIYAETGNASGMKDDGPGSAVARRLAGVSPDGRAVFASPSAAGDHDVVARAADGTSEVVVAGPADDLPDTLADGAILYHRVAGAAIEVWRHAPGAADVRIAEVVNDGAANDVIRCAGDRTAPCVLEELDGGERRYLRIDPVTGARGAELHRAPRTGRFRRGMAVAPDGGTLALVDGSSAVTLIDLDGGAPVRHVVAPGAELQAVAWADGGQRLFVSAIGGGDHLFNLFRVKTDGAAHVLLKSNYRGFARAHETSDGKALVVQARDVVVDVWLAEGL